MVHEWQDRRDDIGAISGPSTSSVRVVVCSWKAAKEGSDVEGVDTGWLAAAAAWSRVLLLMGGEILGRSIITPPLVLARKDCSSGIRGEHVIGRAARAGYIVDIRTLGLGDVKGKWWGVGDLA